MGNHTSLFVGTSHFAIISCRVVQCCDFTKTKSSGLKQSYFKFIVIFIC